MKPAYATYCLFLGIGLASASGVPPTIHVSWSNPNPPVLNFDYRVITTPPASPDFPDVELVTGDQTWRIWSTDQDNPGNIGDIGVISCPFNSNFAVSILGPGDGFGARDVKGFTLVPSSPSNYSSITGLPGFGSRISGVVTDVLIVQADTSGTGGEVELSSGSGVMTADMTIHKVLGLSMPSEVSGTIIIDELVGGGLHIGSLSGSVSIGTANTVVRIIGPISGSVTVSQMASGFVVFFPTGVAQAGKLTFGGVVGPGQLDIGTSGGGMVAGTIQFLSGIPNDMTVHIDGDLTPTGVIDLNDMGVAGILQVHGGGDGTIVNGGVVTGSVELGTLFQSVPLPFSGTATFASVEFGGKIVTDSSAPLVPLTGQVAILGVMNGNLCADNLDPNAALPSNITVGCGIGTLGTICGGEQICPTTGMVAADPPDGTRDARQPHPVGDNSLGARQGIGSQNAYTGGPEPITLTLDFATTGAINHDCWTLCETGIEQTERVPLDPNQLACLTDTGSGVYEIFLERPISAGHWTTVTYEGDGSYVTYSSLPADANDSGVSMSNDIFAFINCCLNQICTPAHGDYTCDTNHSGLVSSADLLRLIDLLNGADAFVVWNGKTIAANTCPGGAASAMMGSGDRNFLAVEAGNIRYMNDLMDLLQRLAMNDRVNRGQLTQMVIGLADFTYQTLAPDERNMLAHWLSDASLTFASDIVAGMIPELVATLRAPR